MAVIDVTEQDFERDVIERSREIPVVVDFWAEWCGPCRMLGPALEKAANAREGQVVLAKLDTDANQATAARYGIRGLPTVKAFRNGEVVDEFTGAQPPQVVDRFVAGLVPSEADELVEGGGEESLRRALEVDPQHPTARRELAKSLLRRGEVEEARQLLDGVTGDFVADGLAARAQLAGDEDLTPAFEAWDRGDHAEALAILQDALADPERRDAIRRVMVAIFTELGADNPLAQEHRRRLSAALY